MINSPDSDGNEGLFGFDFTTYSRDTVGVDADLAFFPAVPIPGDLRDTFLETEGLSGSNLNDALRGGNATAATMADHALTTPGIITGLPVLFRQVRTRSPEATSSWAAVGATSSKAVPATTSSTETPC